MFNLSWRRLCLYGLLYVQAMAAQAQAAPVVDATGITLDEAISRSLKSNPGLLAFGYQIEAQKGEVLQSGLKPNPELDLRLENAVGTGGFGGLDRAEATLSIGWLLEHEVRAGRIAVAESGMSVLETEAEVRRLDVAAETARIFLESLANQERLNRLRGAEELARQTVEILADNVRAGKTPKADLARAEAELASARLDAEDVAHELKSSNRRLAAQWGASEPGFSRVAGNALEMPGSVAFADLQARIEKSPDITRYTTEQHLREAELRLAQARARPSWRVTAGIRRFEISNDHALVAGLTIPLAVRDRNQGGIARARAFLAHNNAERESERIRIETHLFTLHQELEHNLHKVRALREEIVPRHELALADTRKAYQQGRYGYSELRVVQAELIDAQMALIESSIDAHRHVIEIERLVGASLQSLGTRP